MRLFLNKLYLYSGYLAALFILSICLIVVVQVGLNIFDKLSQLLFGTAIGMSIPSYSDFTGFFLAASSFFALAYTLREGGHIRVTLFISVLPRSIRRIVEIGVVFLAGAITVFVTFYTILLTYESWEYGDLSTGIIPVPLWIPQLAVTCGLVVLSIAFADELVGLLRGHDASYEGKGEQLLSDIDAENIQKEKDLTPAGEK